MPDTDKKEVILDIPAVFAIIRQDFQERGLAFIFEEHSVTTARKVIHKLLVESSMSRSKELRTAIALAAQKVYDEWLPDAEGGDEEWAGGGICHNIAEAVQDVLDNLGIESVSVQQSIGENHTYVIALLDDGIYSVDIPPETYETGSGYSWEKKQGVVFDAGDVYIDLLSKDKETWDDYQNEF